MGSHRVRHGWSALACMHALEKEMETHSSILAWESQGRGSLVGRRLWGRTESDTTEATQQQHSSVTKESVCNEGDPDSIPGSGRCPGEGNGNPLHYSCLQNPMDGGAWRATVHEVVRVGHDLAPKPPPPVYICQCYSLSLSPHPLPRLCVHMSSSLRLPCMSCSLFALQIGSSVPFF